jgi:hypothetical protein
LSSDRLGPAPTATYAGERTLHKSQSPILAAGEDLPPDALAVGEDLAMDETTAGSARGCAREISDTTGNSCIVLSSDESSGESAHSTRMTLPTDAAPSTGSAWGGGGRWRASPPVGSSPIGTTPMRPQAEEKRWEGEESDDAPKRKGRSKSSPVPHTMRFLRLRDGREWRDRNAERNRNRQKKVKKAPKTPDQAPPQKEISEEVGTPTHAAGAGSMPSAEPGDHEQRADKRPFTMFDHSPELAAYGGASKWQRRPPHGPESSPRVAHRVQSTPGAEPSDLSAPSDLTQSRGGSAMQWTALFVAGRGLAGPGSPGTSSQKY